MLASARRNQLLALGCLAGLLAGTAPAMAFSSFDVIFDSSIANTSTGSTGVTGKMTFNFSSLSSANNTYNLDLDISNTTKVPGFPNGTLVGFAFNVPDPTIKLLTYDPIFPVFTRVFDFPKSKYHKDGFKDAIPGTPLGLTALTGAKLEPFDSFSFCARSDAKGGGNCTGGDPKSGLNDGQSTKVRFTLTAKPASSTEEVAKSFYTLFNNWTPGAPKSSPQIALRFQQVSVSETKTGGSDKVGGIPKVPPQAPGDTVPGPLPILGAVTAYGFSRRLRRRIASSRSNTVAMH